MGGQYLVSGSNDGTVRLWEISTGRCLQKWEFAGETVVYDVAWSPAAGKSTAYFAVTTGASIYIIAPVGIATPEIAATTSAILNAKIDSLPVEGSFRHKTRTAKGHDRTHEDDELSSSSSSSSSGDGDDDKNNGSASDSSEDM